MRVGLILANNVSASPYVRYYTSVLERLGVGYEVIAWNRLGVAEPGVVAYDLPSALNRPAWGKMVDSYRYSRFVRAQVERAGYDRLVVFTLQNALSLYPLLKNRYRGRYAVDIRDYSFAVRFLKWRLAGAVRDAGLATVSSAGFRVWLPEGVEYAIRHNTEATCPQPMMAAIEGQTRYRVLTIGAIGYYEANRALMDALADDPMFEVAFVGSGYADQMLRAYAAQRRIGNVQFAGRYEKRDEPSLLQGASLLGILCDGSVNSKTAMANRFYLSLVYGIPMMVDAGGEMARWVEHYNVGLVLDKKSDYKQQILSYLQGFDRERFEAGRRACLDVVRQDAAVFERRLEGFLVCSS